MAFSDDAVLARLSSLNESHDSIATASQWIMFHRRHAERTAQIWLQRLKESTSTKRLSLVYLANEVTQQSKARHRPDFVLAFAPIIAEALAVAYKGAPAEIQGKLRRVVEVWADRAIFEPAIQGAIEARMQDVEKSKAAPKSSFGPNASSVPADLAALVVPLQNLEKTSLPTKTSLGTADQDWEKLHDPSAPTPSAPVYAARLNGLLRSLASAEGAVADSVKARRSLISELEKLLNTNRAALAEEEQQLTTLTSRKTETEHKRREVENAIMRTLPSQESSGSPRDGPTQSPGPEPERPEVEELTPPPPESQELGLGISEGQGLGQSDISLRQATTTESPKPSSSGTFAETGPSGIEMLSTLASQYQSLPVSTNGSNKRRRVESDEFPDLGADDGIDADVAEMLRKDSNGV